MANVMECYVKTDKIDEKRVLVSVSDFHLGFENNRYVGFENFEKLIMSLEKISFDYLLVPGDIVNDVKNLEEDLFCDYLSKGLRELTQNKLSFVTYGNHDMMTKVKCGWERADSSRLTDVLNDLSNIVLLDELANFSLRDNKLIGKGFKTANINIVGTSMPFEYYNTDKEDDLSFYKYFNRYRMMRGNKYFDSNSYNILMLHALKDFINFSKTAHESFLSGIDFAVGGHYHNGAMPSWLCPLIRGNSGIISPQMEWFPKDVRGVIDTGGVLVHMGGFTNFRVENPLLNKLSGGPNIFVLHLDALEKNKECGLVKVKRYHI